MPLTYSVDESKIANLFSWIVMNVPDELYEGFRERDGISGGVPLRCPHARAGRTRPLRT